MSLGIHGQIHWASMGRFIGHPWADSLGRFLGQIHWADSLGRFIGQIHWADLSCTWLYPVVPGCTRLYLSCTFRIFTPEIHFSALAGCFEYNIKTFQKLYRLYLTFSLLSKYFLQRVSTDMARPQNRGYNSPTFGQFELRASNRHREMHLRGKIRSGTTDGTTFYNSLLEKLEQLLILCHCTARIQLQGNLRLRWAIYIQFGCLKQVMQNIVVLQNNE